MTTSMIDEPMEATDSYADRIDLHSAQLREELQDTVLGHHEALNDLYDFYYDCREPNWDGFGAEPVGEASFLKAYNLIRSLPLGHPRPSIGAEPDGQITLEWYRNPNRVLSVSVDPRGVLHFAGLFGADKQSGRITIFPDETPDELIHLVRKI